MRQLREWWSGLPLLVRFMLRHALSGVMIGWSLMLVAIQVDLGGLGRLLSSAPDGGLATAILAAAFGVTFGAVGIAVAVISLPWNDP
ncbi:MAG: hypothetical protein AAGC92_11330 [Pseudomonadota bacterium]